MMRNNQYCREDVLVRELQPMLMSLVSLVAAYFDSTIMFMLALFIAFTVNILAGMRADEVVFDMWRLANFKGKKFKDSLWEFFMIVFITYFIKALMDLTHLSDKSVYAVQALIWLALYFYLRNSFRNLCKAYPQFRWIKAVYYILSFGVKEHAPKIMNDAIDKVEEEFNEKD